MQIPRMGGKRNGDKSPRAKRRGHQHPDGDLSSFPATGNQPGKTDGRRQAI